jgi:hypothetical protein
VVVTGEDWRAPGVLLQILREEAGLNLATLAPTSVGESRAAFWVTDLSGTVRLLKIMPGSAADLVTQLRALEAMTARLRARDYPAPRITAFGRTAAFAFWIQQRLPGRPLDLRPGFPDLARLAALLPELIRLNDAQAGLGTGTTDWPAPLIRTLTEGAFDLATLLFYAYDHDGIRARLGARLLELAGPCAARAYLAHIVLRQVDWSVRHHPQAPFTRRHLHLASHIITDIAGGDPPWSRPGQS